MALTSGFFNSDNGDRKYNAVQMGAIFDGLIRDGVYASYGTAFEVKAATGLNITVGKGRAWFDRTWTLNDSVLPLTLAASEAILNRYDAVVLEINLEATVRSNSIKVLKGVGASSPVKPTPTKTPTVSQWPLAWIYRPGGSTTVLQGNIQYVVGTSDCPFVTAPLDRVTTDAMLAQWDAQFKQWFADLRSVLDGNVATNLMGAISAINQWRGATPPLETGAKRSIYGGRDLGPFTNKDLTNIKNGSFLNLAIGDYWTINSRKWRIADFNYWKGIGFGDTANRPHVVVVPDSPLYSTPMLAYRASGKGYSNSQAFSTMNYQALPVARAAFGNDVVLSRTNRYTDETSFGGTYSGANSIRYLDLLSEIQLLGFDNFGAPNPTVDRGQLALFRLDPLAMGSDSAYWVSGSRGDGRFSMVSAGGEFSVEWADFMYGVRPSFAIG